MRRRLMAWADRVFPRARAENTAAGAGRRMGTFVFVILAGLAAATALLAAVWDLAH
jgi:hypothetical protein